MLLLDALHPCAKALVRVFLQTAQALTRLLHLEEDGNEAAEAGHQVAVVAPQRPACGRVRLDERGGIARAPEALTAFSLAERPGAEVSARGRPREGWDAAGSKGFPSK